MVIECSIDTVDAIYLLWPSSVISWAGNTTGRRIGFGLGSDPRGYGFGMCGAAMTVEEARDLFGFVLIGDNFSEFGSLQVARSFLGCGDPPLYAGLVFSAIGDPDAGSYIPGGSSGNVFLEPRPKPIADFFALPLSGDFPLAVQFTDTSQHQPLSWLWNFGNGHLSAQRDPLHTYEAAGFYTVSLKATNASGFDVETKVDYIEVTEPSYHVHPLWSMRIGPL